MPIPSSGMADRQKVRHEPQTREPRTHGLGLAGVTPGFEEETLSLFFPRYVYHLDRPCLQHGGSELRQEITDEPVTSPCKIAQMAHGRQREKD